MSFLDHVGIVRLAVGVATVIGATACPDGTTSIPIEAVTGTIAGRVLEQRDGSPIAGAEISLTPFVPGAITDSAGRFEIDDLPIDSEFTVTATRAGFIGSSVRVPVTRAQPFISIEFTLTRLGG